MEKLYTTCPVELTVSLIGSKWKVLILHDLLNGVKRYSELTRTIKGISAKVLTAMLRDLEKDGIVARKVYPQVPPKVEYSLTDLGKSLEPILLSMKTWGENYQSNKN